LFARAPSLMEALLLSAGIVALAEIGDKTQLLSLVLAARFGRPVPIILGILVATLANHALAGAVGGWVNQALGPQALRWIVGLSFVAMSAWMLVPDRLDEPGAMKLRLGVFGTTAIAFFIAEMGDKTQIATVVLAARYDAFVAVVLGTTIGMMLANVPVVLVGGRAMRQVPIALVQRFSAGIFLAMGLMVLVTGVGEG
jgi:Ca2+/H+ antiporter, TMEM165/GDT1 family